MSPRVNHNTVYAYRVMLTLPEDDFGVTFQLSLPHLMNVWLCEPPALMGCGGKGEVVLSIP